MEKTRLVVPLSRADTSVRTIGPAIEIEGNFVSADVFQTFASLRSTLGEVVASVADETNAFGIIGAIDRAIGQGYA